MSVAQNWLYRGCVSCHQGSLHCVPVAARKKDLETVRSFCNNLVLITVITLHPIFIPLVEKFRIYTCVGKKLEYWEADFL
jgi:hypothetical protein